MNRLNKTLTGILVVLAGLALTGCNDSEPLVDAKFASPSSLVVAGPKNNNLFVANAGSGTLQVLRLDDELDKMTFEESQLIYFPLEIPLGEEKGYPSHLVASNDGAYVLVLDSASQGIHIVNATTLEKKSGEGLFAFKDFLTSPSESGYLSASLVEGRRECGPGCLGEFYVSFKNGGTLVGLRLSKTANEEPTLSEFTRATVQLSSGDGAPGEMAIGPNHQMLFAADVENAVIYQLAVSEGELSLTGSISTGAVAGSLGVSGDGRYLIAARPQLLDVILFSLDDPSGVTLVDLNAQAAPHLTCLDPCSPEEDDSLCLGVHPGASAICTDEAGLSLTGTGYEGIYLGATPAQILPLGGSLGHTSLTIPCRKDLDEEDTVNRVYSEYALVAMTDGAIQMVGLKLRDGEEEEGTVFTPELASFGWCRTTRLETQGDSSELIPDDVIETDFGLLVKLIEPCPEFPDRNRFECLTSISSDRDFPGTGEQEEFGVLSMAGRTQSFSVYFDWEGKISFNLIQDEGGQVTEEGNFTDVELNLGNFEEEIHPGDILEITTDLLWDDAECQTALGANINSLCGVERRIVEVPTKEDPVLVLDTPLPLACFRGGGRIGYRIRMGDAFSVSTSFGQTYRLKPGERFGPGGHTGLNETILFATAVPEDGLDSELSGCERYTEEGFLKSNPDSIYRRSVGNAATDSVNNTFGLKVEDSHYDAFGAGKNDSTQFFVRTGLRLVLDNSRYQVKGTAGRLPSSMIVSSYRGTEKDPVVFTSYAGSNAVLAFTPYYPEMNTDRFKDPAYFLLE